MDDAFCGNNVFNFNGKRVVGYEEAVAFMYRQGLETSEARLYVKALVREYKNNMAEQKRSGKNRNEHTSLAMEG